MDWAKTFDHQQTDAMHMLWIVIQNHCLPGAISVTYLKTELRNFSEKVPAYVK